MKNEYRVLVKCAIHLAGFGVIYLMNRTLYQHLIFVVHRYEKSTSSVSWLLNWHIIKQEYESGTVEA